MTIVISSSKNEKIFIDKDMINIGTNPNCDFQLDLDFDLLITVQYIKSENKCIVMNTFHSDKIFFKGETFGKIEVGNICKLLTADSSEFISIRVLTDETDTARKTIKAIGEEDFTENDIKRLYGSDSNPITRVKIEKQKEDIESARVAIIKQSGYTISDLKHKLSSNFKTSLFLHIAMFFGAVMCAFGLSNYLMGLSIADSANYMHLPTNIKIWFVYSILVYGLCLLMKQGVYQSLLNKSAKGVPPTSKFAETFFIGFATILMLGVYAINLVYFMNVKDFVVFAIFISLFFVGLTAGLAVGCGYFKFNGNALSLNLNKFEYREDFEAVLKAYRQWIERYINNLGKTKIQYIKDKLFNLQIKSVFEIVIGMLTAPFLAYGVSNTLAMCFPEAAGWIRISGLRFSPVFLVLATFLIIFAFFSFVSAFTSTKKIQASEVIKQDGFSDFMHHGVDIYGLEGVRKINSDKIRALSIACSIIFIEFAMNVSYFMTEIGGDLQGIFLSLIAALVPTALLIAETLMLSQTRFEIFACDELISKIDKD